MFGKKNSSVYKINIQFKIVKPDKKFISRPMKKKKTV